MTNKFLTTAKIILGNRLYNDIRAKILFRDLNSPAPLGMPSVKNNIDWSKYLPEAGEAIVNYRAKAAYIISPTQRSGTNFLSNILERHPDVKFPGGENLPYEHCLYSFSEYLKKYSFKTVGAWSKWLEGGDVMIEYHAKCLMGAIGNGILNYFARFSPEESTLLFKTPDSGKIENFFHLFPLSKVIILVRDGRDTVESFSRSWGGRFTFNNICKRWSKRVDSIFNFIENARQSGYEKQIYVVRYDNLNNNTRDEVYKILTFLDLKTEKYPWHELKEIPVLGSSNYKDETGVHWNPVKKDEKFKPTEKWLRWNRGKKETFKKFAGNNLIKLGFAENNDW